MEPTAPPPTHFAVVASLPGGLGVELGHAPAPGWSLAAQATFALALGDVAVVARLPVPALPGAYVGLGPYALWSPLLFPEPLALAPGALVAAGHTWPLPGSMFVAVELGAVAIYAPRGSEGGGNEWGVVPRPQVRVGGHW